MSISTSFHILADLPDGNLWQQQLHVDNGLCDNKDKGDVKKNDERRHRKGGGGKAEDARHRCNNEIKGMMNEHLMAAIGDSMHWQCKAKQKNNQIKRWENDNGDGEQID